jgi:hypothetical protein
MAPSGDGANFRLGSESDRLQEFLIKLEDGAYKDVGIGNVLIQAAARLRFEPA